MGLFRVIAILGVAALVMQPTYSASIGNTCICNLIILDPICGSDGQTYSNDCEFNCAKQLNRNLEIFSKGECGEVQTLPANDEVAPCACPFILDPLCGSDSQTYSNECEFNCNKKFNRNLEVFAKGECIEISNLPAEEKIAEVHNLPAHEAADVCLCNLIILDPICGSDGETYSNDCEFNCAKKLNRNLEVFSRGECGEVQNLPAEEKIVEVHNLPADLEDKPCVCTLIFSPVCGSDGQTYPNECALNCAKKLNRNLEVFSKGQCIEISNLPANDEVTPCACPFILDPLCGSDGETYSNDCEFNCAKKLNRSLEVFSKGECTRVENLPLIKH